jgi:hypothetical protein
MMGKVVHHQKYGYGLTWRADRFGRQSVKFQNGREIGGFSDTELRSVPKDEFDQNKVLESLKAAGLDSYVKTDEPENAPATESILQNTEECYELFESLQEHAKKVEKPEEVAEFKKKAVEVIESSPVDDFTKRKVEKRIDHISDVSRLRQYLDNSVFRFEKLTEEHALKSLNYKLNRTIDKITKVMAAKEDADE